MKNLVIVESPAKAKTISKYLGKDFQVLSSVGHIRSIPTKLKKGQKAIDVNDGFKTIYEVDSSKKKTISELKKAVKLAEQVWLATDEDREGEAIAWHLSEVLKLDLKKTKRIAFHEITKPAIQTAIKNPRSIDMKLVAAQQARQILDRLVGFELSPVIWQKVPGGKSAGRVQSPAVRLVVEREAEIDNFVADFDFKLEAELKTDTQERLKAELAKNLSDEASAQEFLEKLNQATLSVAAIEQKPTERNPQAPFTTSTLQQTANAKLGFSSKQTMACAQRLYQTGKITYMRTDSVNLSQVFLAASADYIKTQFGNEYLKVRNFKTKSASAQEAHEAIRPTDISLEKASSDSKEQKLYELIRKRTLASQMAPAKLEKTIINIKLSNDQRNLVSNGEVVLFDGFLRIWNLNEVDNKLPQLSQGQALKLISANAKQNFKKAPARYTEGSLVKKLEELGIGRPSTYATIIDTIQSRNYVQKGEDISQERQVLILTSDAKKIERQFSSEKYGSQKGKLVATTIGKMISDFLVNHFNQVVDYDFTATIENDFDQIAHGQLERNQMLENFYWPFHRLINNVKEVKRSEVSNARLLGQDPLSGQSIYARFGRFGPMLQMGEGKDELKPRFAPLPTNCKLETISLEQALEAFKLPRQLGKTPDGEEIKANIGRFGPYIQVGKTFVSIKPQDPMTITLDEALTLYRAKQEAEANKIIADWGELKIIRGPYGPYIKRGKQNFKIPKTIDAGALDKTAAESLIKQSPKPKNKTSKKRST